ncbi:MAG: MupG family TIM beta-alpha barrel fold protein [Candidatus Asgardarchaeia archaeon]
MVERELGIVMLPSKFLKSEMESYIEYVASLGFRHIHTSLGFAAIAGMLGYLHPKLKSVSNSIYPIVKEDSIDGLIQMNKIAEKNGMVVNLDTSPPIFEALGASPENLKPFADMGFYSIRLDWGFSIEDTVKMTKNDYGLKIMVNASDFFPEDVRKLVDSGAEIENLMAGHNLYPRPETGLTLDFLIKRSKPFKEYGIKVAAYVASKNSVTPFQAMGMPTLEKHRFMNPGRAAEELFATKVIDIVVMGDVFAGKEELESMVEVAKRDYVKVRVKALCNLLKEEEEIAFNKLHVNRRDAPTGKFLRSNAGRGTLVKPNNTVERCKYAVTVDNIRYFQYSGDLIITLEDLPMDPKVNVVGYVIEEDHDLIKLIGPGDKFKLTKV